MRPSGGFLTTPSTPPHPSADTSPFSVSLCVSIGSGLRSATATTDLD
jgi:hypothetical protein